MIENMPNIEDDDFDDEFTPEDEALFRWIAESLQRPGVSIINPTRVEQMRYAYLQIKQLLKESRCDCKIESGQDEDDPDMGVLSIEGADIRVLDMERFARVAEFADNMEIYPLVTNAIRISYAFYNMTIPIE